MASDLPSAGAHWRDSARMTRIFVIDAKAAFPMLLLLLYIRTWTFVLALVTTVFFTILNRYGFTLEVFGRWLRSLIAGPRKLSMPWWK